MSECIVRRTLFVIVALLITGCATTPTPTPTRAVAPTPLARATAVANIPLATPPPGTRNPPSATPSRTRLPTVVIPVPGAKKDVTYCTVNGVDLKMDLYPPQDLSTPRPLVVFIHGGAWQGGDKSAGEAVNDVPQLAAHGYLVASIDYRLAPKYRWPAMIEDVKCAIRSLRANAATYHIDRNRIAVMGSSAGGQLAAMAGLADQSAGFDVGEYANQSSRVQAVVDLYGPTHLNAPDYDATHFPIILPEVFGATGPADPVLVRASPVTYVSAQAPPFLIIHGDKDATVPPNQSQLLYDRLKAAGATAMLVMVKNAGHSLVPAGAPIQPTRAELTQIMIQFLDQYVK